MSDSKLSWMALVFLLFPPASATAAQEHFYYYEGERRSLEADPGRVAVMRASPQHPAPTELWAALGVPAEQVRALPSRDWFLLTRPDGPRRAGSWLAELETRTELGFVSPVFRASHGGPIVVTPQVLVGFRPEIAAEEAEAILALSGAGEILDRDWGDIPGAYRLQSSRRHGARVLDDANLLAELPAVAWAEPNFIFPVRDGNGPLIPDDPGFPLCWGLHDDDDVDMDMPEAWKVTTGDPDIIVVVIDSGVQLDHPDLNVHPNAPGMDFTNDGGDGGPMHACERHGTAVAGCVAAVINNGLGTVGAAPDCVVASARMKSVLFAPGNCNPGATIYTSQTAWTVDALAWADQIGARVTVNSQSYPENLQSSAIGSAYSITKGRGIVHFASSGNEGEFGINYPASLPSVNAIGAIDGSGGLASWSNRGGGQGFVAPGAGIYTTDRTGADGYDPGDYVSLSGTSFAAPYAAGVAALILSKNPDVDAWCVERYMRDSAVDSGPQGYDPIYGWGRVNGEGALEETPISAGVDSIVLVGPDQAGPGDVVTFFWLDAPPSSPYWLYAGLNLNGSMINCHPFDIGEQNKTLDSGETDGNGMGQYVSPPIPNRYSGRIVHLEVRVDATGTTYDSNALRFSIR